MTNEQLVHEMLLDKDFKVDGNAGMGHEQLVTSRVRETFERAFWGSLAEDLSCQPPMHDRVLSVFREVRVGIEGLSQGHPEQAKIGELIDTETIAARLKQPDIDFGVVVELVDEVVEMLLSMHDRMRCKELREVTQETWVEVRASMQAASTEGQMVKARAMCAALEFLLSRVHAARVEVANSKLRSIAPVIREQGVEYEQKHFARKLDAGAVTLDGTRRWIEHTLQGLAAAKDSRVAVQDLALGRPEAFEVVLNVAYVDIVADFPNWGGVGCSQGEAKVPETLALDKHHIEALNMHFHTEVVSSVIFATVELHCRDHIKDAPLRAEAFKRVQDAIVTRLPKPDHPSAAIRVVRDALCEALSSKSLDACDAMLKKNLDRSSPVYSAMTKIFKRVWYSVFSSSSSRSSVIGMDIPTCARVIMPYTLKNTAKLVSVAALNKKVHVTRYNHIIKTSVEQLTLLSLATRPDPCAEVACVHAG
jgi:hypothetical protein